MVSRTKILIVIVVVAAVAGALYYFMRPTTPPPFGEPAASTTGGSTPGGSTPGGSTPGGSTPGVSTPAVPAVSTGISTPGGGGSTSMAVCPADVLAHPPIHGRGGGGSYTLPEINGTYDSAAYGVVTIHCGQVSSQSAAFAAAFGAASVMLTGEYTHESWHSPVIATGEYLGIDIPAGQSPGTAGSQLNLWPMSESGGVQASVTLTRRA